MNRDEILKIAQKVSDSRNQLADADERLKNRALAAIRDALEGHRGAILAANAEDCDDARQAGIRPALMDRLALNDQRIDEMKNACDIVIALPDPVGQVLESWRQAAGLMIQKVRTPLGPIGIIYESRPNVTVEAAILAIKAGNPVLLKGGSDALRSNLALVAAMVEGLKAAELSADCVGLIPSRDRSSVEVMFQMIDQLSVIIPRGGAALIQYVRQNSRVPVLETGVGNCHIYVDADADLEKSVAVIVNAKTQRPGTCNAAEKALIHRNIAAQFLPSLCEALLSRNVLIKGCEKTRAIINAEPATTEDWETEYLDMIIALKIVDSCDEALEHIRRYSSGHSEAILTNNLANARMFARKIDSAAVYINASTRFTDGGQFGFGAEIGISTQKFHARGPMGLAELTSYKYVLDGDYTIRR